MNLTQEWRDLVNVAKLWQELGYETLMATVVDLEGSSFRRPGVRMLINDQGHMEGAISGGCVEKEVLRQAKSVFETGIPKMMTYNGRFRLGCEGVIRVLIEPVHLSDELKGELKQCFEQRKEFDLIVQYGGNEWDLNLPESQGTQVILGDKAYSLRPGLGTREKKMEIFCQTFPPIFQLFIFGTEDDTLQLCKAANNLGWEVHIVTPQDEEKPFSHFKGASSLKTIKPGEADTLEIDEHSAVVLMTHSLNKDTQYLYALKEIRPAYFGILGPSHRRERIFDELLNLYPSLQFDFMDQVRGPMGLDIGAESSSEIAISILSEILSVIRKAEPKPLNQKIGKIHE